MDAKEIKALRTNLAFSQSEFGELFDPVLSKTEISRLENGRRKPTLRQGEQLDQLRDMLAEEPEIEVTPEGEGRSAYGTGNLDQCPYASATIERRQWIDGWCDRSAEVAAEIAAEKSA